MKVRELQNLLDAQPSVAGNTFLVGALYVLSFIFAVIFLILGVGLLLESFTHLKIFLDWVAGRLNIILDEEQRWRISATFGIISMILSAVFAGVIIISKMILKRNHFIIHIEDWLYQNIPELKKKPKNKINREIDLK